MKSQMFVVSSWSSKQLFFKCYQFYFNTFSVDSCSLLPVSGPCSNNTLRWYYNYVVGRCQQFTYGGCDGNQNNFETLDNCLQQCGKSLTVKSV